MQTGAGDSAADLDRSAVAAQPGAVNTADRDEACYQPKRGAELFGNADGSAEITVALR